MEQRTARLTLLIDPKKKAVFEQLCAKEDVTASQKVRQFIRDYIEQQLGTDWRNQVLTEQESDKTRKS
ncbi:MAG TPA: CopG family transcriptional regulator [Marinagarivorans sp.]